MPQTLASWVTYADPNRHRSRPVVNLADQAHVSPAQPSSTSRAFCNSHGQDRQPAVIENEGRTGRLRARPLRPQRRRRQPRGGQAAHPRGDRAVRRGSPRGRRPDPAAAGGRLDGRRGHGRLISASLANARARERAEKAGVLVQRDQAQQISEKQSPLVPPVRSGLRGKGGSAVARRPPPTPVPRRARLPRKAGAAGAPTRALLSK